MIMLIRSFTRGRRKFVKQQENQVQLSLRMATKALNEISLNSDDYRALGLEPCHQKVPGTPPVLSLLSFALERSIRKNRKSQRKNDSVAVFYSSKAPGLSIFQYIERIFKYSNCSTPCFVMAYIYIKRFLLGTGSCLTSLNVHRLLISSVMTAAKFIDGKCYNNAYYAKIGGLSTTEMNTLEINFLFGLDFRLHVSTETFDKYCLKLENEDSVDIAIQAGGLKHNTEKKQARKQEISSSRSTCITM